MMMSEDSDRTEIRSSRSHESPSLAVDPVRPELGHSGTLHAGDSPLALLRNGSPLGGSPLLPPLPELRRVSDAGLNNTGNDRSYDLETSISETLQTAARGGAKEPPSSVLSHMSPLLPGTPPVGEMAAEIHLSAPAKSLLNAEPGEITSRIRELFQKDLAVGPFTILRPIGGGGMGQIFCARDMELDREVALKVLAVDPMTEDAVRRFHQEARSAARLNHRNIALVWQSGEHGGIPYIAFEYVHGENIRNIVGQKHGDGSEPMPMDVALGYTIQVTSALIHAWRRDVVHRDIKPSNILVTPDGCVKLIDLGLARLERESEDTDLTQSGMTLGTFDYLAPEQAKDARQADCRSDIYSLGCALFFMFTGRPPFVGTSIQKLIEHRDSEPPDVRKLRPDLPEDVAKLLRRMMAKSPSARYQTPEDLLDALRILVDEHHLQLEIPVDQFAASRDISWKRMLERHLPWIVPTLLVIATAVIFRQLDRTPTMMPTMTSPENRPAVLETPSDSPAGTSSVSTPTALPGSMLPPYKVESPITPAPDFGISSSTGTGTLADGIISGEPSGSVAGKISGNGTSGSSGPGGSMLSIQPVFPPDRDSPPAGTSVPDGIGTSMTSRFTDSSPPGLNGYEADEAHAVPVLPARVPWNTEN